MNPSLQRFYFCRSVFHQIFYENERNGKNQSVAEQQEQRGIENFIDGKPKHAGGYDDSPIEKNREHNAHALLYRDSLVGPIKIGKFQIQSKTEYAEEKGKSACQDRGKNCTDRIRGNNDA